jgi:hypothetical protein
VSAPALIPAAVYGLRTWRPAVDESGEHLTGAYDAARWPDGGAWLHATCTASTAHAPPEPGCACGIHGWHPDAQSARRVLASRRDIPGIVEATGAIEVHTDGFRAQRARPYALVTTPGRNAKLTARLAERYAATLVAVDGPDALLVWCREHGLGLDAQTVGSLLGTDLEQERRAATRRRRRTALARGGAAVGVAGALLGAGLAFANGPHSPHGVAGRTGWVVCPDPPPGAPARHPPDC